MKTPDSRTVLLRIGGMSCAACSAACERAIGRLPGIKSVSVNAATSKGSVTYDPSQTDEAAIKAAVEKAGFFIEEAAQKQKNPLKRRFILALCFALPLVYIAMAPMLLGEGAVGPLAPSKAPAAYCLVQLALLLPVLWAGRAFFTSGFPALFRLSPTMDSLVAVGCSAAVIYSLYGTATVLAGGVHGVHGLYFESAAMIITLVLLGKSLETDAKSRTGAAVEKLMKLAPAEAVLLKDGREIAIPVSDIRVGDLLAARPGAAFAVDGVVTDGVSSADESMLTGESLPAEKEPGNEVFAGTVNLGGRLVYRAAKVGADTVLANIVSMVETAQNSKPPIARLADKIAGIFVPAVMAVAVLAAAAWAIAGKDIEFVLGIFISVLVIACPCALGLATPITVVVATGKAASAGILFRSASALQTLASVDTAVFDKTGTLTQGRPRVTAARFFGGGELAALTAAASAESGSDHPLAAAVIAYAKQRGAPTETPDELNEQGGFGVVCRVGGQRVAVGSDRLMKQLGVDISAAQNELETPDFSSAAVIFSAVEGRLSAVFAVADPEKPDAAAAIKRLADMGIKSVMLTGDREKAAEAAAARLGISEVTARVLPGGKTAEIERLRAAGGKVLMVGDGINDAPALAAADVSIAVGGGSDIALEAADVVLVGGEVTGAAGAVTLARAAMKKIKMNLFWAFFYNSCGIPVAAGLIYAFNHTTLLNPMLAAAAMSLSSVCVVTNALLLNRKRLD